MNISINNDLCIGCGACESLCPNVFKVEEDEKSHVLMENGVDESIIREIADNCPTQAMTLE